MSFPTFPTQELMVEIDKDKDAEYAQMMSSFKADSKTANPGLNKGNKYTCELTFFIIRVKSSGKTVPPFKLSKKSR